MVKIRMYYKHILEIYKNMNVFFKKVLGQMMPFTSVLLGVVSFSNSAAKPQTDGKSVTHKTDINDDHGKNDYDKKIAENIKKYPNIPVKILEFLSKNIKVSLRVKGKVSIDLSDNIIGILRSLLEFHIPLVMLEDFNEGYILERLDFFLKEKNINSMIISYIDKLDDNQLFMIQNFLPILEKMLNDVLLHSHLIFVSKFPFFHIEEFCITLFMLEKNIIENKLQNSVDQNDINKIFKEI
jgi:hypothetical protein